MIFKHLLKQSLILADKKFYTCIVERVHPVPIVKKGVDPRNRHLKSIHFQYKWVETLHSKDWGNVDLILTEYVEGVGHKGEIVNVPREFAYYNLIPSRLAVYPTEEYIKMFEKDIKSLSQKSKVSPYAIKTKEYLENFILEIPMNMSVDWNLSKDNIRIALRYQKITCPNENILLSDEFNINSKDPKSYSEPFTIKIQINSTVEANLKCRIVSINSAKLWEEFAIFNRTV